MTDILGIGKKGEEIAAEFLKNNGYEIIEMNFKNRLGRVIGEIDIIAKELKSRELVFVEVKTREYQKYKDTLPEENITPAKLRKLSKIASAWLNYKNLAGASYRFDA
ncbi:MAG: YraN family protein, partial [Candidatus Moranbacteria bacterium CG_4_9_14_3_um_filter_42_9]